MRRLLLTAALLVAAVPPSPGAGPIVPFKDASRLVVIGGSLTEIVFALGEEDRIAARDTTGNYPPAALKLPDIGYMRALSPEGVLSVDPSGILAIAGSGPPAALSVIEHSGVPYEEVPDAFTGQGILDKVLAVGAALGVPDKARALATQIGGEVAATAALTRALPASERKRVLFVLSANGGRLLASGSDTAANGVIAMAGARNAIDGFSGYKPLSAEAVIAAAPDAVLVMDNAGDGSATVRQLAADPAIAATPAGRNAAIIAMDGEELLGFGPRTPAAVQRLAETLYGDKLTSQ